MAYQLNGVKEGIFHGPNYFVPETAMPCVVTIHDLSVYRFPQWHPPARVERVRHDISLAVQRAQLIITVSQATKLEVMQEFGLEADRVQAVLLGVDASFHPRHNSELLPILSRFGLEVGGYSFFVSTIEPRKNLMHLFAAYRQLPQATRERWPLVLVGSPGWQSDEIHTAIERGQAEGWIKYLGYVEEAILPILYAGCRLFTYPSWYEGFGLPIAEAMASGVPVLTSNCSSMPEVAGGAALLVDPGSVESIYTGLQLALEDEQWRQNAVEQGLKRAAELTWDACVQATVAAYKLVQKN